MCLSSLETLSTGVVSPASILNRSKEVVANSDSLSFQTHAVKKIQECKGFQEAQEALALNRRLKEMVAEKQVANQVQENTQQSTQEYNQ